MNKFLGVLLSFVLDCSGFCLLILTIVCMKFVNQESIVDILKIISQTLISITFFLASISIKVSN